MKSPVSSGIVKAVAMLIENIISSEMVNVVVLKKKYNQEACNNLKLFLNNQFLRIIS